VTPTAIVHVRASRHTVPRPEGPATLALGSVEGWLNSSQDLLRLHGTDGASSGVVEYASHRAILCADPGASQATTDLYSMLTVSAAMLLAGLGRALVHAAAVISPEGGAWLLVGDARAGKSTTCATLARVGWGFLSDDQVVLRHGADRVVAEGWLRRFHLDRGWEQGVLTGDRAEVAAADLAAGGWQRTAPLIGLLFPMVRAGRPTLLTPLSAAEAFAGLVRQSPWLLARRDMAAGVAALLQAAVAGPRYRLELGFDTYRDGRSLATSLAAHRPAE